MLGTIQAHKSVILHILAQLKPGVDLTRVRLALIAVGHHPVTMPISTEEQADVEGMVCTVHWLDSLFSQISLPAFILEKRSNLEMIADMFAYTDLYAW